MGQVLQIRAKGITNWDRYCKLGQSLQIGAKQSPVSCHRAIVPSRIRNVFSRVFRKSQIVSRGYFVAIKLFPVDVLWFNTFSRGYFEGPKFYDFQYASINNKKKHMIKEF